MKIIGTVVHLDFENEAFGIVDEDGNKFLPVNMPVQLKREGARVVIRCKPADVMTNIMWGKPVYIYAFETLQNGPV
jgi:hypothetical protein